MATWPATLPQSIFAGASDHRVDGSASFQTDVGPPKRRRISGNVVRNVETPIVLTGAQRETFDMFYSTTLLEGSLEFDWTDPVTDVSASFRFTKSPTFTFVPSTITGGAWRGTLSVERLP